MEWGESSKLKLLQTRQCTKENISNAEERLRRVTDIHILDGSLCRECQQWKSCREDAHDSQAGWEFMQGMSAMEIRLRSCT
jgi:hypothetical protein